METLEKQSFLTASDGTRVEVRNYSTETSGKSIAFAPGFSFCARKYGLIERLSPEYSVYTMSPRNSGESGGQFTIDSYISDFSLLLRHVADKDKVLPYALGHSTGGHVVARILGEERLAESAVLLDPLVWMDEQVPLLLRLVFYAREKLGEPFYAKNLFDPTNSGTYFGEQKISHRHLSDFLNSTRTAMVTKVLLSPTLVVLAGSDCYHRLKSHRHLADKEKKWEELGAEVKNLGGLNHWFNGEVAKKPIDEKDFANNELMLKMISDFLPK